MAAIRATETTGQGNVRRWQVSIGFGLTALYFINCCTWTLWVGIGSLVFGIAMLIWWWVACKRTVVAAVIALIGYAHFVAPQCINTIVGAVVGTISAVLVFALAECAISGTKPSGN